MKTIRTLILFVKRNFHLIIAIMAAIGIISGIANLLAGGMKEDWLSITVNVTVILLFTYYLFTNSRKQYRKIKMEAIKRVAKAEKI